MIVLNLVCSGGHGFEGWFASSGAFRDQQVRGLVECPHCRTTVVSQLPSGPRVRRSSSGEGEAARRGTGADPVPMQSARPDDLQAMMFKALAAMAQRAENVGERFPEEARRIHYDEAPARHIRGVASGEETQALLEEGILVLPAPVPPENETH